eukprot:s2863_g1.t1
MLNKVVGNNADPGRLSFMVGDWHAIPLRISRKRVQLEALGLSSYVAASCGGALGRLCLTEVAETGPIAAEEDLAFRLEDLEYINDRAQRCQSFTDALIGEGAGGRVYRARHRLQSSPTSPYYAVKVFRTKGNTVGRAPPEDLKPDNVVIDSTLCAKLADFGSGRFGASTTGAFSFGHPPGTVGYCAPEVLQRYAHDESADLYSFGVVTWLVFTGGMQNTGPPISQQPEFSSHFYDWAQLHQCVTDNFPPFRGMEGAADPILQARQAGQFTWSLLQGPRERMKHRGIRAHPLLAPLQLPSFADGPEQVERWLQRRLELRKGDTGRPRGQSPRRLDRPEAHLGVADQSPLSPGAVKLTPRNMDWEAQPSEPSSPVVATFIPSSVTAAAARLPIASRFREEDWEADLLAWKKRYGCPEAAELPEESRPGELKPQKTTTRNSPAVAEDTRQDAVDRVVPDSAEVQTPSAAAAESGVPLAPSPAEVPKHVGLNSVVGPEQVPPGRPERPPSRKDRAALRDELGLRAMAPSLQTARPPHSNSGAVKDELGLSNSGAETVQMLTRHWIFVDALGRLAAEVKGPGARGVTPVLPPQGEWTYESGTSLDTPYGSMHGSFQFDLLGASVNGPRSFSARVGRLALSNDGRPKEVPCVDEAKEGMLPLTSVLSVERVILGGRAEFSRRKAGKYYFQYDVQFNNARDSDVDVLSHLWEVVDSQGQRHTVLEGPGVGGAYKHHARPLRAGDAFRVNGEIWSPTKAGNAQGTFRVLIREGDESHEIEARTDFMGLSADKDLTRIWSRNSISGGEAFEVTLLMCRTLSRIPTLPRLWKSCQLSVNRGHVHRMGWVVGPLDRCADAIVCDLTTAHLFRAQNEGCFREST